MAPTIQAAVNYLDGGGQQAIITSPQHIGPALQGTDGTHITPD
jgi:carbamate kinase